MIKVARFFVEVINFILCPCIFNWNTAKAQHFLETSTLNQNVILNLRRKKVSLIIS